MSRPRSIPGMLWLLARMRVREVSRSRIVALAVLLLLVVVAVLALPHRAVDPAGRARLAQAGPQALLARLRAEAVAARAVATPGTSVLWPALVVTREGLGVAWTDTGDSGLDVFLARVDAAGGRLGPPVRISSGTGVKLLPQLAWTGRDFALAWTAVDDDDVDVRFQRVSAQGERLGDPLRFDEGEVDLLPGLAWNGGEHALAWFRVASGGLELALARVSAEGRPVGRPQVLGRGIGAVGGLDLSCAGGQATVALEDYDFLADRTHTVLVLAGREVRRLEVARAPGLSVAPTLAWDGAAWGLAWQDDLGATGRSAPCFARADRQRVLVARRPLADRAGYTEPRLAWSGSSFGAAWGLRKGTSFEVYFARISREGQVLGAPLRVNRASADRQAPDIAWGHDAFSIVWAGGRAARGGLWMARVSAQGGQLGEDQRIVGE